VRAALRAAAERPAAPFVRAAFRAAADRCDAERRRALDRACFAKARDDAALVPSRFNAPRTARERVPDTLRRGRLPFARSRFA